MPRFLLPGVLVVAACAAGLAVPARAQRAAFPAPGTPDPFRPDPGLVSLGRGLDATLLDTQGHWQPVRAANLTAYKVYLSLDQGPQYRAWLPREVSALALAGDTLLGLSGPLSGSRQAGGVFGRQLYRGGGWQLVDRSAERRSWVEKLWRAPELLLRPRAGEWVNVPQRPVAFRALFQTLLADDPAVVAELQRGRARPGRDAARLLQLYAEHRLSRQQPGAAAVPLSRP